MVRKHVVKVNFLSYAVFIIFQLISNLCYICRKKKRTSKSTVWVICQGTICPPPSSGCGPRFLTNFKVKLLANENIKVSVTLSEQKCIQFHVIRTLLPTVAFKDTRKKTHGKISSTLLGSNSISLERPCGII